MTKPLQNPQFCLKCGIICSTRRLAKHKGYCSRCWCSKEIQEKYSK